MMTHRIDRDRQRFHDIVKGKIRENLKDYITNEEIIGSKNGRKVKVPMPQIRIPRFTYGSNKGGIGAGPGEVGDVLGDGPPQKGPSQGQEPTEEEGEHKLELEMDVEDLASILREKLQLPRIEPRGDSSTTVDKYTYDNISRQGPPGLRHFRRSYKEAMKRTIASGKYDPKNPVVIPQKDDWRYKSFNVERKPEFSAVMIYMMDVSGSMDDAKKKLVRSAAFWLDSWIEAHYQNVEKVFLLHDIRAWETDEEDFFQTSTSGGTRASSVYQLCLDVVKDRYPLSDWNVYPFHFSDGDNWESDNEKSINIISELLGLCNQFCYAEVNPSDWAYSGWVKLQSLYETFDQGLIAENVALAKVEGKEDILTMLKSFLGAGR